VGRDFVAGQPVCLILGDNIFYGHGMVSMLRKAAALQHGALVFAYAVQDPARYGVIEFDAQGHAISLEEKPARPRSHYAVPGLYFYDSQVCQMAAGLQPSARGELEITDLNRMYLEKGQLQVQPFGRGIAWLDAGTHEALLQSANFIQAIQERQGVIISSPEEIAYRMGYISRDDFAAHVRELGHGEYARYLARVLDEFPGAGTP
jgi:glucose-1-phosphate thymidylyltransferase